MLGLGVLILLLSWDGKIDRVEGVALFALVPVFLWFSMKRGTWTDFDFGSAMMDREKQHIGLRFIAGSIAVVLGSVLLVQNAVHLARAMGVPELVIGLTLVAVGTSLPELITAVSASLQGHGDMAVGNVMGANVLNIAWVLGGASPHYSLGYRAAIFRSGFTVHAFTDAYVFASRPMEARHGTQGGARSSCGIRVLPDAHVRLLCLRMSGPEKQFSLAVVYRYIKC